MKVSLASDFIPKDANNSLFWFPHLPSYDIDAPDRPLALDSLTFHPLRLNGKLLTTPPKYFSFFPFLYLKILSSYFMKGTMQPLPTLTIPDVKSSQSFALALFLRSEAATQTPIKVKVKLSYIPKDITSSYANPVSKEFEIVISFVRPLQMNFNMTSHKDAPLGRTLSTAFLTFSSETFNTFSLPLILQWLTILGS
jgi:hypothetical protein